MFNLIADAFQAYNQVGLFLGALVCLGIGGLLLGNSAYWRMHALRARGTVIGVLVRNGTYTPVYRYTLPDGQSHEAKSDTSSSAVAGKETGRIVPLMISAHDPSSARKANSYLFDVIGIVCVLPGLLMGYIAVTAYPVTPMTWIMTAGLLIYLGERGWRIFIPKGARPSIEEWRRQRGMGAAVDLTQVKPIEDIVSPAEVRQSRTAERQQARKWAPFVGLFAIMLAALGTYQSVKLAHLQAAGLRAEGRVVRMTRESGSSGHDYTYYPVVEFRTRDNMKVQFKDRVGTNPPSYRAGDKVAVLYLAESSQNDSIIDRGAVWNWTIPGILLLATIVVAAISIGMLQIGRARPAEA